MKTIGRLQPLAYFVSSHGFVGIFKVDLLWVGLSIWFTWHLIMELCNGHHMVDHKDVRDAIIVIPVFDLDYALIEIVFIVFQMSDSKIFVKQALIHQVI